MSFVGGGCVLGVGISVREMYITQGVILYLSISTLEYISLVNKIQRLLLLLNYII